jgi:uncharacterized protein YfiM (DUF2279 family)
MSKFTLILRAWAALSCVTWLCFAAPARAADDDWWGRDKALHFGVSGALAGGGYAVSSLALHSRVQRIAVGTGVALGAGVAKEVYDELNYGGASYKDLVFDVAGVAVGVLTAWLIDLTVDDRRTDTISSREGMFSVRF